MDMRKWFKEAQYGMMVHWGLYSLLAGEYKDRYSGVYAEWIQAHLAIPNAEYGKLTKAFNPVFFNAEEWVKLAKDCGMKYFVVTSKHHDGFAMFHSKVDKYNVVDATPFGRDVVGISRTPHTRTSISALRTRFTRRWRNFSATTAISA